MGFRRAIVPAGSAGLPGPEGVRDERATGQGTLTEVREVADVQTAIVAALAS